MQSNGQGIQFEVFVDKNMPGRLLKIPNDINRSLQVLNKWDVSKDMSSDEKYRWAERSVSNTMKWSRFFVDLISKHPELKPHLAHPEFRSDGSYTQDRVVTIGDYLKTSNRQEARRIFIRPT